MLKEQLKSFYEGSMCNAYEYFGGHLNKNGAVFRVYAPHAQKIEVIGEFNDWHGEQHVMERVDSRGVYEIEIHGAKEGQLYKYRITQANGSVFDKADPYAFYSQLRPDTASILANIHKKEFSDAKWMKKEAEILTSP